MHNYSRALRKAFPYFFLRGAVTNASCAHYLLEVVGVFGASTEVRMSGSSEVQALDLAGIDELADRIFLWRQDG